MKLKVMTEGLTPSDRLIVSYEDGTELYRGYNANIKHTDVNQELNVVRFGLHTEIFRKIKRVSLLEKTEKIVVEPDNYTDFEFSDLEMMIYTKIIVKKSSYEQSS